MSERPMICRSKFWAKQGDMRVVIHVIADDQATRYQVVAQSRTRPAVILGSGTEKDVRAATAAAERMAARITVTPAAGAAAYPTGMHG